MMNLTSSKKIPMRKCVGCQEMKAKKEMIRIVRTEEQGFLLDATGRKNGELISARLRNVLKKPSKTEDWNGHLNRQFQRKYMTNCVRR